MHAYMNVLHLHMTYICIKYIHMHTYVRTPDTTIRNTFSTQSHAIDLIAVATKLADPN